MNELGENYTIGNFSRRHEHSGSDRFSTMEHNIESLNKHVKALDTILERTISSSETTVLKNANNEFREKLEIVKALIDSMKNTRKGDAQRISTLEGNLGKIAESMTKMRSSFGERMNSTTEEIGDKISKVKREISDHVAENMKTYFTTLSNKTISDLNQLRDSFNSQENKINILKESLEKQHHSKHDDLLEDKVRHLTEDLAELRGCIETVNKLESMMRSNMKKIHDLEHGDSHVRSLTERIENEEKRNKDRHNTECTALQQLSKDFSKLIVDNTHFTSTTNSVIENLKHTCKDAMKEIRNQDDEYRNKLAGLNGKVNKCENMLSNYYDSKSHFERDLETIRKKCEIINLAKNTKLSEHELDKICASLERCEASRTYDSLVNIHTQQINDFMKDHKNILDTIERISSNFTDDHSFLKDLRTKVHEMSDSIIQMYESRNEYNTCLEQRLERFSDDLDSLRDKVNTMKVDSDKFFAEEGANLENTKSNIKHLNNISTDVYSKISDLSNMVSSNSGLLSSLNDSTKSNVERITNLEEDVSMFKVNFTVKGHEMPIRSHNNFDSLTERIKALENRLSNDESTLITNSVNCVKKEEQEPVTYCVELDRSEKGVYNFSNKGNGVMFGIVPGYNYKTRKPDERTISMISKEDKEVMLNCKLDVKEVETSYLCTEDLKVGTKINGSHVSNIFTNRGKTTLHVHNAQSYNVAIEGYVTGVNVFVNEWLVPPSKETYVWKRLNAGILIKTGSDSCYVDEDGDVRTNVTYSIEWF